MKFKRYSKFADGHTKLSEEGKVDNKGRTIHSISYFGTGELGTEKRVEFDEANHIVKSYIKFANKETTDVSIAMYKDYPYGEQLVYELYGSVENGEFITEESTYEYDKYGVVWLHRKFNDSGNCNERRFVKYSEEKNTIVTILVSKPFYSLSNEEAEALSEEDKCYGYEVIIYDKRINEILYHKYSDKINGLTYKYKIECGKYERVITDGDSVATTIYDANDNVIYDAREHTVKNDNGETKTYRTTTSYEYDKNNFLKRIIYDNNYYKSKPEYKLVECYYEYEEEKEED